MIFRITDYVHYGTLDNRERGTVRLTLQLMGMPHPVNITCRGTASRIWPVAWLISGIPLPRLFPRNLPRSRNISREWRET